MELAEEKRLQEEEQAGFAGDKLISETPYLTFTKAACILHPAPEFDPGVEDATTAAEPVGGEAN